jgi:hypothetical protein
MSTLNQDVENTPPLIPCDVFVMLVTCLQRPLLFGMETQCKNK